MTFEHVLLTNCIVITPKYIGIELQNIEDQLKKKVFLIGITYNERLFFILHGNFVVLLHILLQLI